MEDLINSPGSATGKGETSGPIPKQDIVPNWVEEETDHLLRARRKGALDRETWGLQKRKVL